MVPFVHVPRHCLPFTFKDSVLVYMVILGFTFDRKHYSFYDIHVLLAHLTALIVKQNKLGCVVRKQAF